MALNLTVKVHPVVLFQIVDAFERRKAESHRVIGTLLGNMKFSIYIEIYIWTIEIRFLSCSSVEFLTVHTSV